MKKLRWYSWFVLFYTVVVILWGAVVRLTGSGAGCGQHWPSCNGKVVPLSPSVETLIEFSHRATSGLSLLFVLGLTVWVFRSMPKGHSARPFAAGSFGFIVVEALIGAVLVLLELVGNNDSATRAFVIALHQANTFLLLGCLAAVCTLLRESLSPQVTRLNRAFLPALATGLVLLCFIAASGAVVALGDTLFPSESFAAGLAADMDPTSHFLIRLRLWHPIIATVGVGVLLSISHTLLKRSPTRVTEAMHYSLVFAVILQLSLGTLNVLMLAPAWLQLAHLAVADGILILFAIMAADQMYGLPAFQSGVREAAVTERVIDPQPKYTDPHASLGIRVHRKLSLPDGH